MSEYGYKIGSFCLISTYKLKFNWIRRKNITTWQMYLGYKHMDTDMVMIAKGEKQDISQLIFILITSVYIKNLYIKDTNRRVHTYSDTTQY